MRGSSWLWKRGDSDSGISSSEGSCSILRRGRDEETKYREETLSRRRRREQEEEQLLRGRRSNSLQRRSQEIHERSRDFYNSGSLLRRVRDESLVGRGEDERDWRWSGSRWEGRRARSQSDAMGGGRQLVESQLWRRRSGSRGVLDSRAHSQPRSDYSDYFYKRQMEPSQNGATRKEAHRMDSSWREEAKEVRVGGTTRRLLHDEDEELTRRRRSSVLRSLSRSRAGKLQSEEKMVRTEMHLGHTLSDIKYRDTDKAALQNDVISKSLLRGTKSLTMPSKRTDRRPAEPQKAILEDESNFARGRAMTMGARPRVSLRRLSRMTSCHHLPRLPTRPLAGSLRSSSCSSLSQDSSATRPAPFLLSSSSTSSLEDREEVLSLAHIDHNLIVHSYVASRGQREKEVEIYEYLPACRLVRPRNLRLGSVSVC